MKRNLAKLVVVFAASGLIALADDAEGSFERALTVSGPVDLDVQTGAGRLDVRASGSGRVSIHGVIRAREHFGGQSAQDKVRALESNPPIEQNGNVVRIGQIHDPDLRRNISISYEVLVPADTKLHSSTGSGTVVVEGLRGPVSADTGSGTVTISRIEDGVRLHTGSGRVELDSIQGNVDAHTGSGPIHGTGIKGRIVADTGSGGIHLEQTGAADIEARAGSGEITLRVPQQAAFNLRAHTGSGGIEVTRPMTVRGTFGHHDLEAKVGGGGNTTVDLSTGSGKIRID
ncbi:MAG: hypothetical protein DMG57_00935 [Acidobacteria bacterium]|nr:MAG: hypothetical protein DMG57_00935 [Acidobacteriota bacterium]